MYSFVPRWNEQAATLEEFEQRVKLFVSPTDKEEIRVWPPTFLHVRPRRKHFSVCVRQLDRCAAGSS